MTARTSATSPRDPGDFLRERIATLPDGRRLRTVVAGAGDGPLVVFEAGMSAPAAAWVTVQRAVSASARTLAYDRAGHLGSDVDAQARTVDRMAQDLATLLDVVDERRPVVLVGHSWGGPILRAFAERHPARVAGVVFVDASLSMAFTARSAPLTAAGFLATSLLVRARAFGLISRMTLPHGPGPGVTDDDMAILARDYGSVEAMRAGAREAAQIGASLDRLRSLERSGTPDVPTVALVGGRVEPRAATRRFRARFEQATRALMDAHPQGRAVVVADAGHLIAQEQPAAVHRAIQEVLDRLR